MSIGEVQKLVGRPASFDNGLFFRPYRKAIVTGVIIRAYLQIKGDNNDHTREFPAHVRVEIGVGNITHDIAWRDVMVVQP